jgi:hypothetical protein
MTAWPVVSKQPTGRAGWCDWSGDYAAESEPLVELDGVDAGASFGGVTLDAGFSDGVVVPTSPDPAVAEALVSFASDDDTTDAPLLG